MIITLEEENTNYDISSALNPAQQEAVKTTEGPLLVLAGAGTGKTRVLTTRIAHILHQRLASPSQILAVTFTNKAAKEMEERVKAIVDCTGIWIGTFHSIAAKILRAHAHLLNLTPYFSIIDASDQLQLVKNLLQQENIDPKATPAKIVLAIISKWKDKGLPPEKISQGDLKGEIDHIARNIYYKYQKSLLESNSVDFGDLLLYNNILFLNNPEVLAYYQNQFKYILIDEYQDTNVAQYIWVRMLAEKYKNICCVGDDDQSIYSWRGAEISNILRFEKDFKDAKVIKLEQNYRSTMEILSAAASVIRNNKLRHDKTLWTSDAGGERIRIVSCWNDKEEARFIASSIESSIRYHNIHPNNIAVLVRAGFQTRPFEEAFMANSIAYKIIGGLKFYERMEIRDVLAYIRVAVNNNDNIALERIINVPKRAIGNATLKAIRDYAEARNISVFTAIKTMCQEGLLKPKIASTLKDFIGLFEKYGELFKYSKPFDVVKAILEESGYLNMWKQEKTEESRVRIDNINEMLRAIAEYSSIEDFLEHASLAIETHNDPHLDGEVNLMTLHASKGLEFDMVFLPGWEEGLFPNQRSMTEEGDKGLEEERRIAYVGITRAKKYLFISHAESRRMYNEFVYSLPSRFIQEIPEVSCIRTTPTKSINFFGSRHNFAMEIEKDLFAPKKEVKTARPSISEESPGIRPGSKVHHVRFGQGIVIKKAADNLEIMFNGIGLKTIKENFVKAV
ncbi:MAG: pcrA [Rickettsiaceae bacterium]|jgi:DNA helicase-2/ATP-dependent DNA helicase PcrA|nr:pcrA [Rickettsiaceae bacterium]